MLPPLPWSSPGAGCKGRGRIRPYRGVGCLGARRLGGGVRPCGSAGFPPARGPGLLPGPSPGNAFGFLQTKALIDKLQKLVSSEGRFKNLREALKK